MMIRPAFEQQARLGETLGGEGRDFPQSASHNVYGDILYGRERRTRPRDHVKMFFALCFRSQVGPIALYKDSNATLIALNRFAFGARGSSGDLARAASDPRGYLTAELIQPAIA